MQIAAIYINTYKYDYPFAKICIASIRYWYPEIPIYLIKDMGAGRFDTSLVETKLNVGVLDTMGKTFGWGFGKFEPLFEKRKESFLFMDADTVMVGPVLEKFKDEDADFIVDKEDLPIEKIIRLYYHPELIRALYEDFKFPGYCFNTGQWVGTSGLINRGDFEQLVKWDPNPSLLFPEIFKQADQGVFNFIIHRKEYKKEVTVTKLPIMIWPENGAADHIEMKAIESKSNEYPFIIHWAGLKRKNLSDFARADILIFFRNYYYQLVGESYRKYDNLSVMYNYWEARTRLFSKKLKKTMGS